MPSLMRFAFTYRRIHVFFAIIVAIDVLNMLISHLRWPTLPAFPELIPGHVFFSLVADAALVGVGLIAQRLLKRRASSETARMATYAVTLGAALAGVFSAGDATLTALLR